MAKVIQYQSGMSNGFFIVDQGIIAVDGGAQLGQEYFLKACSDAAIDPKSIRLLVVSHAHVDHFVNMDEMRKVTGAPLLCHRAAEDTLVNAKLPVCFPRNKVGEKVDAFRIEMTKLHGEPVPFLPPMKPDLTWEGEFDLTPYGVDGKIIETFGHSYSDTCVVLSDGQAVCGDLIVDDEFTDGIPTLAYFGCDPDRNKANALLFPSCEKLLKAGATKFYSGHGGPFTLSQFQFALSAAKAEAGIREE